MYQKFQAGLLVDRIDPFVFKSNRFEIWKNGGLVKSQELSNHISISTSLSSKNDFRLMNIKFLTQNHLIEYIKSDLCFDCSYYGTDRMIGATIPSVSNNDKIESYSIFKSLAIIITGFTRGEKNFEPNEPYACSLFLIDDLPAKLTFSNGLMETLIEFYWD
jgi:hypothetical protein